MERNRIFSWVYRPNDMARGQSVCNNKFFARDSVAAQRNFSLRDLWAKRHRPQTFYRQRKVYPPRQCGAAPKNIFGSMGQATLTADSPPAKKNPARDNVARHGFFENTFSSTTNEKPCGLTDNPEKAQAHNTSLLKSGRTVR